MDKRNFFTKQLKTRVRSKAAQPMPAIIAETHTNKVYSDPLGTLSRNFTRHKLGNNGKWDTGNVRPVLCKNGGVKQYMCEMSFHPF